MVTNRHPSYTPRRILSTLSRTINPGESGSGLGGLDESALGPCRTLLFRSAGARSFATFDPGGLRPGLHSGAASRLVLSRFRSMFLSGKLNCDTDSKRLIYMYFRPARSDSAQGRANAAPSLAPFRDKP